MDDIFGELFRSVFGLPRRSVPRDYSVPDEGHQHRQDGFPGGSEFFGSPFPFFGPIFPGMTPRDGTRRREDHPDYDGSRRDPFGFGMFDIFEHMRSLFEEFDLHDLPGNDGALMPPSLEPQNPRDNMLKEDDTQPPAFHRQNPFFGHFYGLPDINSDNSTSKRQDTDLDKEVEDGNLDVILGHRGLEKSDGFLQPSPNIRPSRSFKSVTVHRYRNNNGEIEERKTIRDGEGNEEIIITRQVGDKKHIIRKHKDPTGTEHVTESYDNVDENEIQDFASKWKSRRLPPEGSVDQPPSRGYQPDPETKSIFRKLFGRDFPGFSGSES